MPKPTTGTTLWRSTGEGDARPQRPAPRHALTTLHYIVAKYAGREPANTLVDWVLAHLEIVPQDRAQFVRARNLRFDDFEDAALASAAEAAGCKLILTRNVADFGASPVPAVTPEEFLLTVSQG